MSDGSIKFDTKVDTSGVKQGKKEINKEISGITKLANKMKEAFKFSKKDTQIELKYAAQKPQSFFEDNIKDEEYAIKNINAELNQAKANLANLQQMQKSGNYDYIEKEVVKTTDQVKVLEDALKKSQQALEDNKGWLEERVEIDKAKKKVDELQAKMDKMNSTGVKKSSQSYKNLSYDLKKAKADLDALSHETDATGANLKELDAEFEKIGDSAKKNGEKVSEAMDKKVSKSTKKAGSSIKYFTRMIMSMFVMQALFTLMRVFTEGMQDMANVCPDVNENLSAIMSSLDYLKNSFLAAFSPLIGIVVPVVNAICGALATLLQYISMVIAALTGKSTFKVAVKQQKDYAASLKKTGGAAKDTEKALAGFDEINQLNLNKSGGGGGSEGADPNAFKDVPVDSKLTKTFEKILAILKQIVDIFKQGFFDGLGDTWKTQFAEIMDDMLSIKESLIDIFMDPAVQDSILEFGKSFIYMLGAVTGSIASVGISIAQGLIGGIAKYLEENKGFLKLAIINTFNSLALSADSFAGIAIALAEIFTVLGSDSAQSFVAALISVFSNSVVALITVISMLFGEILQGIYLIIQENIPALQEAIMGFLEIITVPLQLIAILIEQAFASFLTAWNKYIQPFIKNFSKGVSDIIGALLRLWNQYVVPILTQIGQMVVTTFQTHIKPIMDKVFEIIGKVGELINILLNDYLVPFIDWVVDTFGPMIESIIEAVGTAFNGFLDTVMIVIDNVLLALDGLITFLIGAFTGDWETALEGLKNIFKGVFNGIMTIAEDTINFIVDCLNSLSFDVPEWVPVVGGKHFGFNLSRVSLPRLATGTVVPPNAGEFAAILGDNKRETEVVSPLSTMKEALAEVLAEQGNEVHLEVNGNLAALIRLLKIELAKEDKRKGKKLVIA